MAGKGDSYRPVDREKFNKNFERIFGTCDEPKQGQCDNFGCGAFGLCPECQAENDEKPKGKQDG